VTSEPWHRAHPEVYAELKELINWEFPELHFIERGDLLVLAGNFVIEEGGHILDRFKVEIFIPPGGPRSAIPVVREVGGRIAWTADRHVYTNGNACLFVPDAFWYEHPRGMDLVAFLRGPVRGYFVGQSLVERGEPWPSGEWPHGPEGIAAFYMSVLGINDHARIRSTLEVIEAKKIRAQHPCPCGSDRAIRHCHLGVFKRLRDRIPRAQIRQSLVILRSNTWPKR
jgi:hypothetical protein